MHCGKIFHRLRKRLRELLCWGLSAKPKCDIMRGLFGRRLRINCDSLQLHELPNWNLLVFWCERMFVLRRRQFPKYQRLAQLFELLRWAVSADHRRRRLVKLHQLRSGHLHGCFWCERMRQLRRGHLRTIDGGDELLQLRRGVLCCHPRGIGMYNLCSGQLHECSRRNELR